MGWPRSLEAVHLQAAGAGATAQVDPDRVLLLDVNYTNNSKTLKPQGGAGRDQVVVEVDGLAARTRCCRGRSSRDRPFGLRVWHPSRQSRPGALLGVWIITLLASVPLTLSVRAAIVQHLGSSLEADTAASGVNDNWMLEFAEQAGGVNATFRPTVIGFGAVLDNLSAFADRESGPPRSLASACCICWPGRFSPAASSIATRATGRRQRRRFFKRAADFSAG